MVLKDVSKTGPRMHLQLHYERGYRSPQDVWWPNNRGELYNPFRNK